MTAELVDWPVVALILAGAVAGGIVNGLTGFGTALTGLPLWLQAVEPLIAAQLASACSVLGHLTTLPEIWRAAAWRRLAPMLIAGLLGVPIGTWLLPLVSLATFKVAVGVTLIAYCSFMLLASGWRAKVSAGGRIAEAVVGFGGGILGGIAGLSGVLPTVYATLTGWAKEERRVVLPDLQPAGSERDAGGQRGAGPSRARTAAGAGRRGSRNASGLVAGRGNLSPSR